MLLLVIIGAQGVACRIFVYRLIAIPIRRSLAFAVSMQLEKIIFSTENVQYTLYIIMRERVLLSEEGVAVYNAVSIKLFSNPRFEEHLRTQARPSFASSCIHSSPFFTLLNFQTQHVEYCAGCPPGSRIWLGSFCPSCSLWPV